MILGAFHVYEDLRGRSTCGADTRQEGCRPQEGCSAQEGRGCQAQEDDCHKEEGARCLMHCMLPECRPVSAPVDLPTSVHLRANILGQMTSSQVSVCSIRMLLMMSLKQDVTNSPSLLTDGLPWLQDAPKKAAPAKA